MGIVNLRTGEQMTRRSVITGIGGIIAAGCAPSIASGAARIVSREPLEGSANASVGRGMMRNVGRRVDAMRGDDLQLYYDDSEWNDNFELLPKPGISATKDIIPVAPSHDVAWIYLSDNYTHEYVVFLSESREFVDAYSINHYATGVNFRRITHSSYQNITGALYSVNKSAKDICSVIDLTSKKVLFGGKSFVRNAYVEANGYLNSSGQFVADENYRLSNLVSVQGSDAEDQLLLVNSYQSSVAKMFMYDENGNEINYWSINGFRSDIKVLQGTKYIRVPFHQYDMNIISIYNLTKKTLLFRI